MIAIHENKVKSIQKNFETEIEDQRTKALGKLKKTNKNLFNQDGKDYLIKVISLFEDENLLLSTPEEIDALILRIGKVPIDSRVTKRGKPKQLKKFILDKLNY
ncbi:MAG: hypothetical protein IH948_07470, partial [Bacteroidetes bacterium]|nr:hypothetical protein [Bacteroidota bacterium]